MLTHTKENIVINFLLSRKNGLQTISMRKVAKLLKVSPALVSNVVKKMKKDNVLTKDGFFNEKDAYARSLKILLNVSLLKHIKLLEKFSRLKPKAIGFYGSWANGTNNEDSDFDLWAKFDYDKIDQRMVASVQGELRKALNVNTQLLILTPEKLKSIKKTDPVFYYDLYFSSIVLYGDGVD